MVMMTIVTIHDDAGGGIGGGSEDENCRMLALIIMALA